MTLGYDSIVILAADIALGLLSIALVPIVYRLVRGPSLADRIIAVDLAGTVAVGVFAVYAVRTDRSTLLDPALVIALISFLGTVVFAWYLERMGSE